MKLVNQSVKLIPQESGLEGINKQIEEAARTCYKSEDKIMKGSAERIVYNLINNKHTAMLEHGTVYLTIPNNRSVREYLPYSYINEDKDNWYITTNYRVIKENHLESDLEYLTDPTEFHEKRITVKCITSIGIGRELCRHRKFSFAQESTRYCNYSKDKFDNNITFIIPNWVTLNNGPYEYDSNGEFIGDGYIDDISSNTKEAKLLWVLSEIEDTYKEYSKSGLKAQDIRDILPLCTKSEIVITGFEEDWKHFFDLRLKETTGKVHPDMKILAQMIYENIYGAQSN